MNGRTLTDDGIDTLIVEIVDYLDRHPLVCSPIEGDAYDHFTDFLRQRLEPYSNGYRNYN